MNNRVHTFYTHSFCYNTKFLNHSAHFIIKNFPLPSPISLELYFTVITVKLFCNYILPDFLFNGFLFILSRLFFWKLYQMDVGLLGISSTSLDDFFFLLLNFMHLWCILGTLVHFLSQLTDLLCSNDYSVYI